MIVRPSAAQAAAYGTVSPPFDDSPPDRPSLGCLRAARRLSWGGGLAIGLVAWQLLPTGVARGQDAPVGDAAGPVGEIIVTATRTPKQTSSTGRSTEILTSRHLEALGAQDAVDALDQAAGLQIARTAGRGRVTSIFLRGGESDHTLVMIDGVQVNLDGGQVDLGWLDAYDIERIEVVRGPASSIYGPDGLAGVVNIITRRGQGAPTATLELGGGTFADYRTSLSLGGSSADDRVAYRFSGLLNGIEDGYYENSDLTRQSAGGGVNVRLAPRTDLDLTTRWNHDDVGVYTTGEGNRFTGEDPNDSQEQTDWLTGVTLRQEWVDGVETSVRYSYYLQELEFQTREDDVEDFFGDSLFRSDFARHAVQVGQLWTVNDRLRLLAGYEREDEELEQETFPGAPRTTFDRTNDGVYLQVEAVPVEWWDVTGAVRYDDNSDFGGQTVGSVFTAYRLDRTATVVRGGWAQGIKAPTFIEVAGFPSFGVAGLGADAEPESSNAWEAGVDQDLLDRRLRLGVTYAATDFEDLVQFAPDRFEQVDEAETRAVEFTGRWRLHPAWRITGNVTWLDTDDDQGNDLLRRAEWSYAGALVYEPTDAVQVAADLRGIGDRDDRDFRDGSRVESDGYHVVGLTASYRFTDHLRAFARVDNLFDEDYEEVYGFPSDPIHAFFGLQARRTF